MLSNIDCSNTLKSLIDSLLQDDINIRSDWNTFFNNPWFKSTITIMDREESKNISIKNPNRTGFEFNIKETYFDKPIMPSSSPSPSAFIDNSLDISILSKLISSTSKLKGVLKNIF